MYNIKNIHIKIGRNCIMKKLKKAAAFAAGLVTAMSCVSGRIAPIRNNSAKAAAESVLAFPGAVGGGRYATGGRGGEVVHVTNLNDSGAGSFRDAVSKPNRIVVFDVSGTIELASNILVSDNVTIAGQTAPGGSGITLKNYKLGMSGNNIICRYLSSRPGPYMATSSGNDAWGGAKGSNSIIDHCSMSWTTDEQWGLYSNNEYYTVQYSVIGPADSWGGHSKGIHGFGLMMGKGYSTFDHNLIIHNVSRNFRGKVVGTETADFTNNVIYNWAYQTAYGTIGHLNYVNNTLKMGNGTTGGKHYVSVDSSTSPQNFKIYLSGNRMLNKDDSVYGTVTYDNWAGITVKDGLGITLDDLKSSSSFTTEVNGVNVSTALTAESAEDSYAHVLSYAGNGISPDARTDVDKQAANEALTGTGNLSGTAAYSEADDAQKEKLDSYKIQCGVTYTYPSAVLEKAITDSDNDGMPDEWELARGLNPNDPGDTNGDYCGQGYTNIEYYINDLTVDSFPDGVVTPSPEMSIETISAFETIEAENFSEQSGVTTEDCSEGGQNVGYIENGDYIMFRGVDFDNGAKSFTARLAGGTAGIELYLDRLTDQPVASLSFNGTDGWQNWENVSFNIPTISGVHSLYIRFTGGEGYLLNINNFVFGRDAVPLSGRLITNLVVNDSDNASSWKIAEKASAGSLVFGDRDVTFTELPNELDGAEQILTACDSKYYEAELASFTAGEDITVYAGFDARVSPLPSWLAAWKETGLTCTNSGDVVFNLYRLDVSKGDTVILGANGQSASCVNYTVFAVESSSVGPTEATEPSTVPETDIPTTDKEIIYGDADSSMEININDVVAVMCYAADPSGSTMTESELDAADVFQRGDGVNASDAISIQKYLAKVIMALPESWK